MSSHPHAKRRTHWGTVRRLVAGLSLIYIVMTALVYNAQDGMLYVPLVESTEHVKERADALGLKPWPDGFENYTGFVSATPSTPSRGTIICVHGNGGDAITRKFYIDALQPLGFNVLLYEYPGYGARTGFLREGNFVNDLRNVIEKLDQQHQSPIYLLGESMGAGVCGSIVANPHPSIKGLILITPWKSLTDMAQHLFWYLPTQFLLKDRYDTAHNIQNFKYPIAIVKCDQDEIIPPVSSQFLYDSLRGKKKLIVFPDSHHNDWPKEASLPWWKDVTDFVTTR